MQQICDELLGEYRALANLCEDLSLRQWQLRTDFYGWTARDEVAHLAYFDEAGLLAATDREQFAVHRVALQQELAAGEEISAIARRRYANLDDAALLAHWRSQHESLVAALTANEARARLPWYGPDMSARSFASARLMETWAHGQDVWDALKRPRGHSPGLRNIAHLGVTTYGWTFANRRLVAPEPQPFVSLDAPDGSNWTWGTPSERDFVRGAAQDFALLVTQRRHRDDTRLQWRGAAAEQWTLLAQCFAGPPADGPAAGVRGRPA